MKRVSMLLLTLLALSLVLAGCGNKPATPSGSAPASGSETMSGHGTEGGTPPGMPDHSAMGMGAPAVESQGGTSPSAAAGLAWTVPAKWTLGTERPMRVATYAVPASGGDTEGGECAVFYFGPNQGGGVDANIERWIGQFEQGAKSARSQKEVNGLKVSLVDVTGSYLAPSGPMMQSSGSKPGYRLLGAIAEGPEGAVFFKFTGPAKSVQAAKGDFDRMVASIKKG